MLSLVQMSKERSDFKEKLNRSIEVHGGPAVPVDDSELLQLVYKMRKFSSWRVLRADKEVSEGMTQVR